MNGVENGLFLFTIPEEKRHIRDKLLQALLWSGSQLEQLLQQYYSSNSCETIKGFRFEVHERVELPHRIFLNMMMKEFPLLYSMTIKEM
jgi:hypothetical protein